jgi:hypothetical protein
MNRPGRHRIVVDLPIEIHKTIKEYTEAAGMTMTKFIVRLLIKTIEEIEKNKK